MLRPSRQQEPDANLYGIRIRDIRDTWAIDAPSDTKTVEKPVVPRCFNVGSRDAPPVEGEARRRRCPRRASPRHLPRALLDDSRRDAGLGVLFGCGAQTVRQQEGLHKVCDRNFLNRDNVFAYDDAAASSQADLTPKCASSEVGAIQCRISRPLQACSVARVQRERLSRIFEVSSEMVEVHGELTQEILSFGGPHGTVLQKRTASVAKDRWIASFEERTCSDESRQEEAAALRRAALSACMRARARLVAVCMECSLEFSGSTTNVSQPPACQRCTGDALRTGGPAVPFRTLMHVSPLLPDPHHDQERRRLADTWV